MTAKQTIQEIKNKYPKYGRSGDYAPYCVGGAICMSDRGIIAPETREYGFLAYPLSWDLGEALQHYNPELSEYKAREYARAVMNANDNGNFDLAWEIAEKALDYDSNGNNSENQEKLP